MRIDRVCVLGGSGFVGRSLLNQLVAGGLKVRLLTRRADRCKEIRVLPGLELVEVDVFDRTALTGAFAGCDAAVNLIGILNERRDDGSGFRRVHVELAQTVIEACRESGVPRLLHMSALNAEISAPSHYLRTQGEAENLVHAAQGIAVTSFRPSVIFGPQDSFVNRFAALLRLMPVFPLACPDARFAPVFVGDVARAMSEALTMREDFGRRIELCGPREYRLIEIVRYIASVLHLRRCILPLPAWAARVQSEVLEHFPGKPFSRDNHRSLSVASVCGAGKRCPTPLEAVVPAYL